MGKVRSVQFSFALTCFNLLLFLLFLREPCRPITDSRRSLFEPAGKELAKTYAEKREILYDGLRGLLPESCFAKLGDAKRQEEPTKPLTRPTHSNLTTSQINYIAQATIGQSQNQAWHLHRSGKITASNFYKVYTKVETTKGANGSNCSGQKLVEDLLRNNSPPENLPALKYGRDMEMIAKEIYIKLFEKERKDTSYRECGLFFDESKQYLGASPDLLIECSCCGKGVLEIKCPYSIANEIPKQKNIHGLELYGVVS